MFWLLLIISTVQPRICRYASNSDILGLSVASLSWKSLTHNSQVLESPVYNSIESLLAIFLLRTTLKTQQPLAFIILSLSL